MQTIRKQTLKEGIYNVEVKFSAYGRPNLTAVEEKEIIENYGLVIDYKKITFSGKFDVVDGNVVEITSPTAMGDEINIDLIPQVLVLDETFVVSYSVKASAIKDAMLTSALKTKDLLASAMCILFGNRIDEAITKVIDEAVAKTNGFETTDTVTL